VVNHFLSQFEDYFFYDFERLVQKFLL
jgi:hypothetical protein